MNTRTRIRAGLVGFAAALLGMTWTFAAAAPYPEKTIRMVVGWPPGGASDVVARIVADGMSRGLGQPVIVDNRPGAGGNIGAHLVARAAPDGYTIFLATTSFGTNPSLFKDLPFDAVKDFTPVSLVATSPFTLVVNNSVPVTTVRELIDLAKASPGKLNYGSHGPGSTAHLAAELFKSMTGTNIVMVPYKGGPPAVTGLLANEVQVMFDSALTVLPLAKSGKVRLLGTTGSARSSVAPDTPTIGETVPGYEVTTWFGILAPAGIPADALARLNKEIRVALEVPETKERIARVGGQAVSSSPEETSALVAKEIKKWAKVVQESGATAR